MAEQVFFYGTLMTPFDRSGRRRIEQFLTYTGRGAIAGALFDLGIYPAAIPASEGRVWGEVYEMTRQDAVLQSLDEIEGFRAEDPESSLYTRIQTPVTLEDGSSVTAWTYFYNAPLGRAERIESGDYLEHLRGALDSAPVRFHPLQKRLDRPAHPLARLDKLHPAAIRDDVLVDVADARVDDASLTTSDRSPSVRRRSCSESRWSGVRVSWNFPEGDLPTDQRHKTKLWLNYRPTWVPGMTLSLLQTLDSGIPYGAANASGVDARPAVTNPGYLVPPPGTVTTYYYTARDAFTTEGQRRTDFAANYNFRIPAARGLELFAQLQVINLFDQSQLCVCGGTAFGTGAAQNAGGYNIQRIDTTTLTPVTTATLAAFNPFTTTPVQGTNWNLGPNFGKAISRFAYTTPQSMRVSLGVRF